MRAAGSAVSPTRSVREHSLSDARRAAPLRLVTATALFDGHDASIQVFRRLLVQKGAEVIHLGHNRSAAEIAQAAVEEDADGVAVSSYQGGHNEFFRYLFDLLRKTGRRETRIYGGGGGVIRPDEAAALEDYGIARIYGPGDARTPGIEAIVEDMLEDTAGARRSRRPRPPARLLESLSPGKRPPARTVSELITLAESGAFREEERARLAALAPRPPVLGITGTGGAGKSSVLDELLSRFRARHAGSASASLTPIGVLAIDPSKRRSGGALLGDRIRLNSAFGADIFVRSLATRSSGTELAEVVDDAVRVLGAAGYRLVIVETGGIGQGSAGIVEVSDFSLYVMTAEYGAESQLDKINMLELADAVAVNKADRPGSEDALQAVRRVVRRARCLPWDSPVPVLPTVASRFADPGLDRLAEIIRAGLQGGAQHLAAVLEAIPEGAFEDLHEAPGLSVIPAARTGYLAEIAGTIREERARIDREVARVRRLEHLEAALAELEASGLTPAGHGPATDDSQEAAHRALANAASGARAALSPESRRLLGAWPERAARYRSARTSYRVRNRRTEVETLRHSLSGIPVPKVALPRYSSRSDLLRFLLDENLPGHYPFTAGVFPFRRVKESVRRQFAGEGGPVRTNRRFHLLAGADDAVRLSVAFDSITLYGEDPARRPDIFGKIGEGGVSIATLEDMERLFAGFRLADPATSVSMTINGPAPAILAMFLNTAVRQEADAFARDKGRRPTDDEWERLRERTLRTVRGTVQADILKEDQAQNTCIFSTGFALRLMGDVQEFFVKYGVRNFYSASVSGYHIAEAGANPVTQLAFTLANGFTYVEYFLARGLRVDDFVRNLSFFFSNGLDPEYTVLIRVARRIWARAMKLRYGGGERSQKFKVHIQTSGRSLHAREVRFNDIRTTLQALTATNDNCNSLHTNAYDEAITTPTAESVRRAVAIQRIIREEFGATWSENPLSGSFIINELTDLVEQAVLREFDRIHARGGVIAAMEHQYQRRRIQDESLSYETKKDAGEIPLIGVNTFLAGDEPEGPDPVAVARASPEEKEERVRAVEAFRARHAEAAAPALRKLQETALGGGNVFAELMDTVRVASLGQISRALYEVGGRYRRAM